MSGRVQRRQAERFAERDAQIYADRNQAYANATAVPAAPAAPDRIDQLRELGELRASGVLTEAEFASEKAKIMGGT